jgi:hypothetical protein
MEIIKATYAPYSNNLSYKDKQNEYMKERTDFLNKVDDDIQVIEDNAAINSYSTPLTDDAPVSSVRERISRIQAQRKQQEDLLITPKTSPGIYICIFLNIYA